MLNRAPWLRGSHHFAISRTLNPLSDYDSYPFPKLIRCTWTLYHMSPFQPVINLKFKLFQSFKIAWVNVMWAKCQHMSRHAEEWKDLMTTDSVKLGLHFLSVCAFVLAYRIQFFFLSFWSNFADEILSPATLWRTKWVSQFVWHIHDLSHVRRKPVVSNESAQLQWLAMYRVLNLRIVQVYRQWTTKALIRLRGSTTLLFAYGINMIFSWRGLNSIYFSRVTKFQIRYLEIGFISMK